MKEKKKYIYIYIYYHFIFVKNKIQLLSEIFGFGREILQLG